MVWVSFHILFLVSAIPAGNYAVMFVMYGTAPEFGFFIILPAFFQSRLGFSQSQYLNVLSAIFLSNILWNLPFGMIGDRWGWRRTVAICGSFGCTLSTLAP